ncbi:MAG: hypothetical protein E7053_02335 [Lentisphaerae bacterium]|nr:hypothetical protein [Lentisphaerota bacterium]
MSYGLDSKNYPPKSRFTFILLSLFFNSLGLHLFYIGYAGGGVFTLLWNAATVYFALQGEQMVETVLWMYGIHWVVTLIGIISADTDARNMPLQ